MLLVYKNKRGSRVFRVAQLALCPSEVFEELIIMADLDAFIESLMQSEKPSTKFPDSMYYTEGTKYLNLRMYSEAIKFLDEAVAVDKTSIKSRLKRSRCNIGLREYEKSIEDADLILRLNPGCVEAMDLKGEAQFLMGDFEGGYVTYLNGRRLNLIRNEPRLGKQLCAEAIHKAFESAHKRRITKNDALQVLKTKKSDKVFEEKLKNKRIKQDCFEKDKKFLEKLMKEESLSTVHGYCKDAIDYIKDRQRFWAMVTPLHTRMEVPKVVNRVPEKPDMVKREISKIESAIRRAESAILRRRTGECLTEIEKVLAAVETLPSEKQKEKLKLKCDAFHVLSKAHKSEGNEVLFIKYVQKELEIACLLDLKIARIRSYHALGEYFQRQGNVQQVLQFFNKIRLMQSSSSIELLKREMRSNEIAQLQSAQDWINTIAI